MTFDQQEPQQPVRRWRRTRPAVAAVTVVGATLASIGIGHELWPAGTSSTATTSSYTSTSIASNIDAALVDIDTVFGYQSAEGAGTGIVLTTSGEILTNNHVIDGATSISVTDIGNGKTYKATVVGYDSTDDIAVLQLQGASGLKTAKIGNSSNVKVGDAVTAIGNAGGTGGTPSSASGTVSALDQAITASDSLDGASEQLTSLIETNADVQAGDSGGSLVNSQGAVIGMDTAAASGYSLQSTGSQGYAIPINEAITIARQIEAGKSTSTVHIGATAFLGVEISSASSNDTSPYGSVGGNTYGSSASGATVAGVTQGSAAEQAGLVAGDVITAINGQTVSSSSDMSKVIAQKKPGDKVTITYTDSAGQSHTTTVDLGSGPPA